MPVYDGEGKMLTGSGVAPDHGNLNGLDGDDHPQYPLISSGAGAPSSTPSRVGLIYVDTTNYKVYIATGTSSSADWTLVSYNDYILIQDQKTAGTDAGGASSGSWITRDLNTIVTDTGGHCSLSSNQFTLAKGTYIVNANAPSYRVGVHRIQLYNATTTTVIHTGQNSLSHNTYVGAAPALLTYTFTITSSTAFELRHRVQTTQNTNGLGF
ncbi:MAG: hypothetical protein KC496_17080, partial [Anaerolineae bacterium]|nr:hypothetical protein [Anaerolineae bacterium]